MTEAAQVWSLLMLAGSVALLVYHFIGKRHSPKHH